MTGGGARAAASVDQAVQEIEHISALHEAWVQADREITQEESALHGYLAGPTSDLRLTLQDAGRSLAAALDCLVVHGGHDDVEAAREIKTIYQRRVVAMRAMTTAADAGNLVLANAIHDQPIHPAYGTLQYKIGAFADRELGHNLGLRVVAEGVETRATWEHLDALGCDTAQGYLLSRPVPAPDLEGWLRRVTSPWSSPRTPAACSRRTTSPWRAAFSDSSETTATRSAGPDP